MTSEGPAQHAPGAENQSERVGPYGAALALLLIVALGFVLRVYRLGDQSIWADEYGAVSNLDTPDVWTDLWFIELVNPEQAAAPLYYIIQYFWAHWVSDSLISLRLLSILLGMMAVPLTYVLGSYLYGRTAGLVAALCLALSPQHIWYDQEPRVYPLVTLLAVLSAYALMRAFRDGSKKWWAVNLAANILLPWTHVFTVFFLLAEGCFLLVFLRRVSFKRLTLWAGIQFLFLIPWTLRILDMPYSQYFLISGVGIPDIFYTIMAGDIVMIHTDLLPAWKTSPAHTLPAHWSLLLSVRPWFDRALLGVSCCIATWLLGRIGLTWWRRARGGRAAELPAHELENAVFLVLLLVLPGLVLGILDIITGSAFLGFMYVMYSAVALYIAAGAVIASMPHHAFRAFAVLLLVCLYAYQLVILLPHVTRTNWRAGADHIRANGSPEDLVLNLDYVAPVSTIRYYLGADGLPIQRIETFHAAWEHAVSFLNQRPLDAASAEDSRSVWLVFLEKNAAIAFATKDTLDLLQRGFSACGLRTSYKAFPGQWNLVVIRIQRKPGAPCQMAPEPVPPWRDVDYARILADLGLSYADPGARDEAIAALRSGVNYWWPPFCTAKYVLYTGDLLRVGHVDLAEAFARKAIRREPSFGLGHFALGLALAARGDDQGAMRAFHRAYARHRGLEKVLGPFVSALCESHDYNAAYAQAQELGKRGTFFVGPGLYAVARSKVEQSTSGRLSLEKGFLSQER